MQNTNIDLAKLLPLIIPVLIIQFGMQIFALVDLYRQPAENIKGSKWMWVAIILLGEIIGPIIYLVLARTEA